MPLLKGKFRPATSLARSRSNSQSEPDEARPRSSSFSEYDSLKRPATELRSGAFQSSPCSAFKVPTSPMIATIGGLISPRKQQPLYHTSPRKTPTTPFTSPGGSIPSPGGMVMHHRRPVSPHFIQPPPDITSPTNQLKQPVITTPKQRLDSTDLLHEGHPSLPLPEKSEVVCAERGDSASEYNDSDTHSVSSFTGEVVYERKSRKQAKHLGRIDKTVMTMRDLIQFRLPRDPANPLKQIWQDIKEREEREKLGEKEKEKEKQSRIEQIIAEAAERGETLKPEDVENEESLPPIAVQLDPITGEIVVNKETLEVKLNSKTEIQETIEEDEGELTFGRYEDHHVSINSFSRRKRIQRCKWTEGDTKRFYLALRKVGTDFELMHNVLPEFTRDQLKRKFKREEKNCLAKVDMALNYSLRMDDSPLEREEEPEKPVEKPKRERNKAPKPTLTTVIRERRKRALSETDEEGETPPFRSRQRSRPLGIDDEDGSQPIDIIRDSSIDRKVVV
eukprot:sb/3464018/